MKKSFSDLLDYHVSAHAVMNLSWFRPLRSFEFPIPSNARHCVGGGCWRFSYVCFCFSEKCSVTVGTLCQVEKVVLFFLERQGLIAEELQRLRNERSELEAQGTNDDEATQRLMEEYRFVCAVFSTTPAKLSSLSKVFWASLYPPLLCRQVGVELLRLLQFVEINTTGLRKIIKKFERRVECAFRDHYISSRANHPYSQLQQIFRQTVRAYLLFLPDI